MIFQGWAGHDQLFARLEDEVRDAKVLGSHREGVGLPDGGKLQPQVGSVFPGEYSFQAHQWVDEKIGLGGVMWVLTLTASLALISPQPRPYHCNPLQHTTLNSDIGRKLYLRLQ